MSEYINRGTAFDAVTDLAGKASTRSAYEAVWKSARALKKIPAADVAPVVHGRFVHDGPRFAGGVDWWHCSSCGRLASGIETRFDYCPTAGREWIRRKLTMDEYIRRDALIAEFERLSLGENSLVEKFFAHGVYAVIETFPAADVVSIEVLKKWLY